jgi:hypothetical protein
VGSSMLAAALSPAPTAVPTGGMASSVNPPAGSGVVVKDPPRSRSGGAHARAARSPRHRPFAR